MTKYKYRLHNLDCAACANKIEEHLNKLPNIHNVCVNYSKLTLTFSSEENDLKKYVTTKIQEVEPDVTLLELDEEKNDEVIFDVIKLVIGLLITLLAYLNHESPLGTILYIIAYIIFLSEIFVKALKLLFKSFTIDENLLITISCVGAYFTHNTLEGLMVVILYDIGEILEHLAVNKSRKEIANLMDIKPEYANLKIKDEITKVDPSTVKVGDTIVVKKGEKIPLDGIIIEGTTSLNTIALSGESKPLEVSKGSNVLSGTINIGDVITLKVTNLYEDSTVSRILDLVENATNRKAHTENFVAKASKIYTPIVIVLAILVAITFPIFFDISQSDAIYRALSFLVISCPCAIAISVPLSYFTGLGAASHEGILIKGSDYLDSFKDISKIVFDKTGTLTTGKFDSYNLIILDDTYSKEEIINYYVNGESLSTHPLANSILHNFNVKPHNKEIKNFKEIAGKGLTYEINNQKVSIGSSSFIKADTKDNSIYLKIDQDIIAKLELTDTIKKEAKETISYLNKMNITPYMYTGDNKDTALSIASSLGINEVEYELLPENKYKLLEKLIKENKEGKVVFIGDGINDAPSLALSDIGISMGNIGSAAAIEASDIVLINDDISKLITTHQISKKTNRIIKENLIFALLTKVIVLVLAALGISSMWHAVFADTGVTLITIINTTRILKRNKK